MKAEQWLPGDGGGWDWAWLAGHTRDDTNSLQEGGGGGYMGISICQNSSNYTLSGYFLVYVKYNLGKLDFKRCP